MSRFHRIELDLELLTDVCLSTSNRTLGEAQTHAFVPGRTLWGAAASAAYRSGMSDQEAFRLFHRGAVRVLDAVPMADGARAYPAPRSWHEPKARVKPAGAAASDQVYNFALEAARNGQEGVQCKPLGDHWVTPDRRYVEVTSTYSLRTAIGSAGRAREGLLFGLPVILAGTKLAGALIGLKSDVEQVAALLTDRELYLGRSRNTELGLVRASRRDGGFRSLAHGQGRVTSVSFLCVSRCILRRPDTGEPTLIPFPEAFGLDSFWTNDEASSFVRTVRVTHFNSKRCRPERERYALERGSVLTFSSGSSDVDLGALVDFVEGGVGEHLGEGYGDVVVAPEWLTVGNLTLAAESQTPASSGKAPSDELYAWACQRAGQRRLAVDLYESACDAARGLQSNGVPAAQWGTLHRMARQARFRADGSPLLQEVQEYLKSGKRGIASVWRSARKPLLEACEKRKSEELPLFLEHLASACMRPAGGDDR